MIEKLYEAIEHYGRYYRIFEMFESHTGWLWFTLEMFSNQPDLRYGLVCGTQREFDYFSMKDMNPFNTGHLEVIIQNLGKSIEEYKAKLVDIVDSTRITFSINNSEKVRKYYEIFLNTMAAVASLAIIPYIPSIFFAKE